MKISTGKQDRITGTENPRWSVFTGSMARFELSSASQMSLHSLACDLFNRRSERTICVDGAGVTVQMSTSEWGDSTSTGVISTSSMKHTKETSLGNNEVELADAAVSKRKETTKVDQK